MLIVDRTSYGQGNTIFASFENGRRRTSKSPKGRIESPRSLTFPFISLSALSLFPLLLSFRFFSFTLSFIFIFDHRVFGGIGYPSL